jgi:hypothetical protein
MASGIRGRRVRTTVRFGAAGLVVLVVLAVMAGPALGTTYTVHEAMKTLATKLGSESKLEGWGSYSVAEKQQIVKALGIEEFLSQEYRDASPGALMAHYEVGLDEASKTSAESYGDELAANAESVVAEGPVEQAIGVSTLEEAGPAVGAPELVAGGLAILGAFGAGYYIGTKLVEVFGDPSEESEGGAGAVISDEAWLRVIPISGWTSTLGAELYTGGPHNPWEEGGPVKGPGGATVEERWLGGNGYFPGTLPAPSVPVHTPYYVLAFKTEGAGSWSAAGPAAMLEGSHHSAWFDDYKKEYAAEGCTEGAWIDPPEIAGWPPKLHAGNLVTSTEPYFASCTPWEEILNEKHEVERRYMGSKSWRGMQAYYWRNGSEFSIGLPHSGGTCSGECPTVPVPSLPTPKKLGEGVEEAFSGSGPSIAPEEWLESTPLPGEVPRGYSPAVEETATGLEKKHSEEAEPEEPAPEPKEKEKLRTAAKECLDLTAKADLPSKLCLELPIFMPGNDVKEPAENDAAAILERPSWVRLENESGAEKLSNGELRSWYATYPCMGEAGVGDQCDEYPFYASKQGGPPKEDKPQPRLQYVNGAQNELEGSQYSGFKSACKLTGTHRPFLVVPTLTSPTARLCNE